MNLLIYVLVAYGISNIAVFGKIFNEPRWWLQDNAKLIGELLSCMMCTSFWVGAFLSTGFYSPTQDYGFATGYWSVFLDACLASGAVWVIHTAQEYLENNQKKEA